MLTFKPVAQRDLSRLRRYYKDCNYQLCEYSALVKLMWRGHLHPQYAEAAGCLAFSQFSMPPPWAGALQSACTEGCAPDLPTATSTCSSCSAKTVVFILISPLL